MSWFLFYGHKMGFCTEEIESMRYGQMLSLLNCMSIYEGMADPKKTKRHMSFDEVTKLR